MILRVRGHTAPAYVPALIRKGGECGRRDAGNRHLFPLADENPADIIIRHVTSKEHGRLH